MLGTRSAGAAGELAGSALILEAAGAAAVESALRTGREAGAAGGATLVATIKDGPAALNAGACGVGPRCRSGRRRRWRRCLVDGTGARLRHNHFPGRRDNWSRGCADRLCGGFRSLGRDVQSSAVGGCRCCDSRSNGSGCWSRFKLRQGRGGGLGAHSCLGRFRDGGGSSCLDFGFRCDNFSWRRDDWRRDGCGWCCHRCRWLNHDSGYWRCNGNGGTRRGRARQRSGGCAGGSGRWTSDDNGA